MRDCADAAPVIIASASSAGRNFVMGYVILQPGVPSNLLRRGWHCRRMMIDDYLAVAVPNVGEAVARWEDFALAVLDI